MKRETRDLLISAPIVLAGFIGLTYLTRFTDSLGVSRWLTGVVGLTTFFGSLLAFSYRKLDEMRQQGGLLLLGGLLVLSGASVVNEFVVHLFSPSIGYVLLAFGPSLALVGYREYFAKKNP
jgi:hypothetical protein